MGRGERGTAMGGTGCRVGAAYVSSSARDDGRGLSLEPGSNGIDIEVSRHHTLSDFQSINVSAEDSTVPF